MGPFLGPLPPLLREMVKRWVADASGAFERGWDWPNAVRLTRRHWLTQAGEVLFVQPAHVPRDDPATALLVEDGPEKVNVIREAAAERPDLALWLPTRPPFAISCPKCAGDRSDNRSCLECGGLGWTFADFERDLRGNTCQALVAEEVSLGDQPARITGKAFLGLSDAEPIEWYLDLSDRWYWAFLATPLPAPGSVRFEEERQYHYVDLAARYGLRGKQLDCWRVPQPEPQARLEFADGAAVVFEFEGANGPITVRFEAKKDVSSAAEQPPSA